VRGGVPRYRWHCFPVAPPVRALWGRGIWRLKALKADGRDGRGGRHAAAAADADVWSVALTVTRSRHARIALCAAACTSCMLPAAPLLARGDHARLLLLHSSPWLVPLLTLCGTHYRARGISSTAAGLAFRTCAIFHLWLSCKAWLCCLLRRRARTESAAPQNVRGGKRLMPRGDATSAAHRLRQQNRAIPATATTAAARLARFAFSSAPPAAASPSFFSAAQAALTDALAAGALRQARGDASKPGLRATGSARAAARCSAGGAVPHTAPLRAARLPSLPAARRRGTGDSVLYLPIRHYYRILLPATCALPYALLFACLSPRFLHLFSLSISYAGPHER